MIKNFILFIFTCAIIYSESYSGYLKSIETSFCMDQCSMYYLESENGGFITNITSLDLQHDQDNLFPYLNRFVEVIGQETWCIECSALLVDTISLSSDCEMPVPCFADPCEISEECQLNTPTECISNYCGGCYADFYDIDGNLVNCYPNYEPSLCDDLENVFFGVCDMFLGYAIVDESCEGVSGCGWDSNGIDYSNIFFDTIEDCEINCLDEPYICEDIEYDYNQLHSGTACEVDNDCAAVWGHCDVGLGGCHYSVNEELYPEEEINSLVQQWVNDDCMQSVCDCMDLPYAQCVDGECTSAYCQGDNPAGCYETGCEDGYVCIDDFNFCTPSTCFCDPSVFYGYWYCTEDCGGGSCVILGDINGDTSIDIVDVVSTVNSVLEDSYNILVDMNSDNNLNVADIVIIINIILGI